MTTNPSPRKRNRRHIADQAVTVPTKAAIPVCTVDDVFNRRFNDGPHPVPLSGRAPAAVHRRAAAHRALHRTAPATEARLTGDGGSVVPPGGGVSSQAANYYGQTAWYVGPGGTNSCHRSAARARPVVAHKNEAGSISSRTSHSRTPPPLALARVLPSGLY